MSSPIATGDRLLRTSAPGLDRAQTIEIVTVALLRWMERHRTVYHADIARAVAGGDRKVISRFVSREVPSLALAQRIVDAYPEIAAEIGEPVVCHHCGRLPHFPRACPDGRVLSTP